MFQIDEIVKFGRARGEQTLGKVVKIGRTGKIKIEQLEARGVNPIGSVWTVDPAAVYKTTEAAPPKAPKRTEDEIMEDILDTYVQLSPECLSGDGEYPTSHVRRKYRELQMQLQTLTTELGRKVDAIEANNWYRAKREAVHGKNAPAPVGRPLISLPRW